MRDAFESALRDNPDNLAGWCAFADWLAEQGDPRGEFMQTQIALEDESRPKAERAELKKKEVALLKKHRKRWLGALATIEKDEDHPVEFTFARGWLSRAHFASLTVEQARALVAAPGAQFLRALDIESVEYDAPTGVYVYTGVNYPPGPDVPDGGQQIEAPGLHALLRAPALAGLRSFRLGSGGTGLDGADDAEHYASATGAIAHQLVAKMPALEELYLLATRVDGGAIFALPLPNLRVLQFYFGAAYPLEVLAANPSLTNLTTLLCRPLGMRTGDENGGARLRLPHLRALCRSPHLQSLRHLRLWLSDFGDAGAQELVSSGLLGRLKTLDLARGSIGDAGARALAAHPDTKKLDYLNLSINAITPAGRRALIDAGIKADTSGQHALNAVQFDTALVYEYLFYGDSE